jgi:hypothetical protein
MVGAIRRLRHTVTTGLIVWCGLVGAGPRVASAQDPASAPDARPDARKVEAEAPPADGAADLLGGRVDRGKELEEVDVRELAEKLAEMRDRRARLKHEIERLEAARDTLEEATSGKQRRAALLAKLLVDDDALQDAAKEPASDDGSSVCEALRHRAYQMSVTLAEATRLLRTLASRSSAGPAALREGMGWFDEGVDDYAAHELGQELRASSSSQCNKDVHERLRALAARSRTVIDRLGRERENAEDLVDTRLARVFKALAARKKEDQDVAAATKHINIELRRRGTASTSAIAKLPWLVGLLALFSLAIMVMVHRFRRDIQAEWIRSGQVIQFMTVTVLVTVVLILGLADKINSEALGTLLGGVAGYVLSQGILQRQRNDQSFRGGRDEERVPPDGAPLQSPVNDKSKAGASGSQGKDEVGGQSEQQPAT